ncbi:MAG: Gldg family protein, partial [Hyphomicrobiales bacterium]
MNWLNGLNRRTLGIGSIIAAAILLLAVNLFSAEVFRGARADLTENKLFTIADGTRELLQKIDEPIEVKLYFSDLIGQLSPAYRRYFEQVRGLLRRYSEISGGNVQVNAVSPEPFSDAEDRAVGAGLQSIPLGDTGETGYFGLVATNSTDNMEVIPLISPDGQPFLEYTLSSLLFKLSDPSKKIIGYMTGVPIEGTFSPQGQVPPWRVLSQLRDFYDTRRVTLTGGNVDDNIDMLILFQPAGLIEEEIYAIEQFALSGKPVIALTDPNVEVGQNEVMRFAGADLFLDLMKSWGVEMPSNKVVGDLDNARRIQFAGPGGQPQILDYVLWQMLSQTNFDTSDPVFSGISRLAFATAGALSHGKEAKTTFTPLVFTSANSQEIPAVVAAQPDPKRLIAEFEPTGTPLTLAARVRGEAMSMHGSTAPQFKKPKAASSEGQEGSENDQPKKTLELPPHRESGTVNIMIVSDVDWLFDRFWVTVTRILGQEIAQPTANNGDLLINLAENMLGGNALIGVRGRGIDTRPFTYVQKLERKAAAKYREREQVLNTKLEDVQKKIEQIQVREGAEGAEIILTEDDRKTILGFRTEMIEIRRQLREVQRALREDIDRTEFWLKVMNIAIIPLLIAIGGIMVLA